MPLPDTPYILSTDAWAFITSSNYADMRSKLLNSGTLATDAPVTISQTWNNAAVAFTGLKFNAAGTSDANSASGSLLADFQLGGVSKAWVTKQGGYRASIGQFVNGNGIGFAGGLNTGFYSVAGEQIFLAANNSVPIEFKSTSIVVNLTTTFGFGQVGVGADTILLRDGAANTLALRNGALAQTFNVYGTSSAANANYARLALTCGLDGNASISTQALGTGTAGTVSINGVPVGLGKGNTSTNIAIGSSALNSFGSGGLNIAIGLNALSNHINVNTSTAVGVSALQNITSGDGNTVYGRNAGRYVTANASLTSATNSIFLGFDARAAANAQDNQIVIGYDATGIGSNSVVLGNDSITKTALKGNVGIGTPSPSSKLHVVGDAVLTGDLLGTNYTIGVPTILTQSNISITNNHSGVADSAIVITPKGTGGVIFGPKPDGTATGGNARGAGSIDLQIARGSSNEVASGINSFIAGGYGNRASATYAVILGGSGNVASANYASISGGQSCTASGLNSVVGGGQSNTASAQYSVIGGGSSNLAQSYLAGVGGGVSNISNGYASYIGGGTSHSATGAYAFIGGGAVNNAPAENSMCLGGNYSLADRHGLFAHANGRFAATGDAQKTTAVFRNKTTTNSAVELFLNGTAARYTITSGKIISMLINITGTKSDGSAVAHYVRQYSIKNIGGTTSQVYAAVTVGTDNAAGTSIAISADDTNDSLKIEVTGVASETWRWVASVDAVEVGHGV